MITKTKLQKKIEKKKNPELAETLLLCKKNEKWLEVGKILSKGRNSKVVKNLSEINSETKEGERIIIPGKVLSLGNLDKKIKIFAYNFSKNAEEKLKEKKIEYGKILEEIKKNPSAEGIRIIK